MKLKVITAVSPASDIVWELLETGLDETPPVGVPWEPTIDEMVEP